MSKIFITLPKTIFLFGALLLLLGCQPTRFLTTDTPLYRGAEVEYEGGKKSLPTKRVRNELSYKLTPEPNSRLLGAYWRLWLHAKVKEPKKEKGLRNWLKNKLGEPPVLYNAQRIEQNRLIVQKLLKDNGYLQAQVQVDTQMVKHGVQAVYSVQSNGRYEVHSYQLQGDTTQLMRLFQEAKNKSPIRTKRAYLLANIDEERARLQELAQNNGYYQFPVDQLYFYLDTLVDPGQLLDVYMEVQTPANQPDYLPYSIGRTSFNTTYNLGNNPSAATIDTLREGQYSLIQRQSLVRLGALKAAMLQDSGAIYSKERERQTIAYLIDLGIFQFVNLKYDERLINGQPVLDREIRLTPRLTQDIGADLEVTTERSNALGAALNLNYTHHNLLKGAENFSNTLTVGVETQSGLGGPFFNTFESAFQSQLSWPRLLLPFKIRRRDRSNIPRTSASLTFNYQERTNLFANFTSTAAWSYQWQRNRRFQTRFTPFNWSIVRLIKQSEGLDALIKDNPRLGISLQDILILSSQYRITAGNAASRPNRNGQQLIAELETAGLISNSLSGIGKEEKGHFLGSPIAQFIRLQLDGRYYMQVRRKSRLASRLFLGVAVPYGNSEEVPFVRQFFTGGTNSIRAFRFRSVGPGSYTPGAADSASLINNFDRVGDIKLEANIEYRFPIFSYLKGAVFLDAGNVWRIKDTGNTQPGSIFDWSDFYREIAIGTGLGIRLDIDFLVIRLDLGIPLRDPARPLGDRWLWEEIQLGRRQWRSNNLVYNIGIGYPF